MKLSTLAAGPLAAGPLAAVAILATTAPVATAAPVSAPSAESAVALSISPDSGVVQIRNGRSGKYLEIENSSTANGANAQIWRKAGQSGMYWY